MHSKFSAERGVQIDSCPFLIEYLFIPRHSCAVIYLITDETFTTIVVDENVSSDIIIITCESCPQTEIIILEVARAETLIEKTNPLSQRTPEKHAKADNPW